MSNRVTIVKYHYVRSIAESRYSGIKGLELKFFREQLGFLRRHYKIVTMEDVIDSLYLDRSLPPRAVVLTFDDAYIDHYTCVFPILDELGVQGSFYMPVKAVVEQEVLPMNKIHFILASEKDTKTLLAHVFELLDKHREDYALESNEHYYARLAHPGRFDTEETMFIKRLLQSELTESLRNAISDELFETYVGACPKAFSRELYLNTDQAKTMGRHGMHIGVHGYNHCRLSTLNSEQLCNEIDCSLDFLRSVDVALTNWTMCYPYGDYDQETLDILKDRGCALALTTRVDVAELSLSNRYELPRLDTNDLPKCSAMRPNHWYEKA